MKIVHVFKDFYPPLAAGITRYIRDVASGAAAKGHAVEVHVAGVRNNRRERLADGVVICRHREFGRVLSSPLSPGLVLGVSQLEADIIHLHMPNPLGELGALCGRGRGAIVVSFHAQLGRQHYFEPAYGPVRRAVLKRAANVFVSSRAMADAPELREFGHKVNILPYGVSPSLVSTSLASRQSLATGRLRALFVGRLVYYKGVDVLLHAVADCNGIDLTIIGDGPLRRELETLVNDLGLAQRVRFAGVVSDADLIMAYRQHDFLVLPSVSSAEAFGLAMIEAMAFGLPVISTQLRTGTDWVNADGVTGIVVPPGEASSLLTALRRLQDGGFRRSLGQAARARAMTHFSFIDHLDALLSAYAAAMGAGS